MTSASPPAPVAVCSFCFRIYMMYAAKEVTTDIEETYERHLSSAHGLSK